jgi:multiple sugar transport system substrate-binding protein
MLRRTLLTSALALALAVPAAAQMAPEVTRPVTITFYNYNLASAGLGRDATLELIANFEAKHPNIKVEGIGVPSNEILSRVQADIVAGQTVDVAQLVFRDLIYAAEQLGAQPLEDVAGAELAAHAEGFFPNALALGEVNGKTYGLAYVFSTPVMFVNRTLFREAGLDPDMPLTTWADVAAAGRQIAERTGKHGFFPGAYGPIDGTFVYQAILMSNGGQVRDGNRLTFAEPEGIEAVQTLREMIDAGSHARIDVASHMDTFRAGNLGMFLFTSAVLSTFARAAEGNFELGLAAMPAFGDKPTAPTNSGAAIFMLSDDPVRQRAAWELMKYLTSDEAYNIITAKIGYLPLRLGTLEDPRYLKGWIEANPMFRVNLEQLDRIRPNMAFPGPNYRQVENMMKEAVTEAVFGTRPVAEVLIEAQARGQALMPSN